MYSVKSSLNCLSIIVARKSSQIRNFALSYDISFIKSSTIQASFMGTCPTPFYKRSKLHTVVGWSMHYLSYQGKRYNDFAPTLVQKSRVRGLRKNKPLYMLHLDGTHLQQQLCTLEPQKNQLGYLQLGGLQHLYTVDAGFLYAGMLFGSTNLTSPGLKRRSVCLRRGLQKQMS